MTEIWHTWKWYVLLIALAVLLSIAFTLGAPVVHSITKVSAAPAAYQAAMTLAPSALTADAAVVYDPETGKILFGKNETMPLPLASLTKLMAADVVLQTGSGDTTVLITPQNAAEINDPGDLGIKAGQNWQTSELVRYGLFASSNNAMLAATDAVVGTSTVERMNERATELGLTSSKFYNPTGLDVNETLAGAYGSARDVAVLAANFYKDYPEYFENTMRPGANFAAGSDEVSALPTSAPIEDIPGVLAAKTGYTTLAGGNMVVLFDVALGHPLVAVVLHSTQEGRFADIRTLIAAARAESDTTP
jgi:D-alanyl-D-alanine carboxypeptidase